MSKQFVMSQDDAVALWNSVSGDYFEAQLVDYAAKAINFYTDTLPGSAILSDADARIQDYAEQHMLTLEEAVDALTAEGFPPVAPCVTKMTPTTPSPISDQAAGVLIEILEESQSYVHFHAKDPEDGHIAEDLSERIDRAVAALSTAPTTGSAPNERDFEAYRRGVMEAFHVANICNVTRHDRTPEETCSYIVCSLARLANGGEEPIVPPASPAASVLSDEQIDEIFMEWNSRCHGSPMESHRRFARALLAASMGGDRT